MKNVKHVLTVVAPVLLMSSLAMANGLDTSWLQVQGDVNLDYFGKDSQDYASNLRVQSTNIKLTAEVAKGIRAVVKASIDQDLRVNGADVGSTFDSKKFLEEAYIEVKMDELTGTPVAVVIGKQAMAFGQQMSNLPMYKDNLLYSANTIKDVIGVTVKLDNRLLGQAFDSLEVSAFETGANDMEIGDGRGLSIRASKQLTETLKATVSSAFMERADLGNKSEHLRDLERRSTLGLVYDNGNGTWKAYAEGIIINGEAAYADARYGATGGATIKAGPGVVAIEYSYLEKVAQEVAVAYNVPVGQFLTVSPEVRHTFEQDSGAASDTRIGVRMKASFGDNQKAKQN